jgi:hypothetical protein
MDSFSNGWIDPIGQSFTDIQSRIIHGNSFILSAGESLQHCDFPIPYFECCKLVNLNCAMAVYVHNNTILRLVLIVEKNSRHLTRFPYLHYISSTHENINSNNLLFGLLCNVPKYCFEDVDQK